MATAFPLSTYPLSDKSTFVDDHSVIRDLLDDGTMRVRVVGDSTYRTIRCVFEHLSSTTLNTFQAYLITNRVTEFTLTIAFSSPSMTYTGYFWSEPQVTVSNGSLYTVTVDFRGSVS